MRLQPAFQRAKVERAAVAGDFAALKKDGQGGNAADIEAGGQLRFGFGIDLDQPGLRFEVAGRLLEEAQGTRAAARSETLASG